ncbi:hypothetical protein [Georgenia wangjunii]
MGYWEHGPELVEFDPRSRAPFPVDPSALADGGVTAGDDDESTPA